MCLLSSLLCKICQLFKSFKIFIYGSKKILKEQKLKKQADEQTKQQKIKWKEIENQSLQAWRLNLCWCSPEHLGLILTPGISARWKLTLLSLPASCPGHTCSFLKSQHTLLLLKVLVLWKTLRSFSLDFMHSSLFFDCSLFVTGVSRLLVCFSIFNESSLLF